MTLNSGQAAQSSHELPRAGERWSPNHEPLSPVFRTESPLRRQPLLIYRHTSSSVATIAVVAALFCVWTSTLYAQSSRLQIYWTDRGVNYWTEGMRTDTFSGVGGGVVPGIPAKGQILIKMPADSQMPKSKSEWDALGNRIHAELSQRVQGAIRSEVSAIEVLQVQNMTLGQHLMGSLIVDDGRQANIDKWSELVGQALHRIKQDFSATVTAWGGSNGGKTLANTIPRLKEAGFNPVNAVVFENSRGGIEATARTINALGPENVKIVITKGDVPAPDRTIANQEPSERLKRLYPGITVLRVEPPTGEVRGSDSGQFSVNRSQDTLRGNETDPDSVGFSRNHIIMMKSDAPPVQVRELGRDGKYADPVQVANRQDFLHILQVQRSAQAAFPNLETGVVNSNPAGSAPPLDPTASSLSERFVDTYSGKPSPPSRSGPDAGVQAERAELVREIDRRLREMPEVIKLKPMDEYPNRQGAYYTPDGGQTNRRVPTPSPFESTTTSRICMWASCLGSPQQSPDGLRAVPYASFSDLPGNRFWDAGWAVYDGDKEIARGFGDVKLLGGGRFAATGWNDGGYRVYDNSGKPLTDRLLFFEALGGDGYYAHMNKPGMTAICDRNNQVIKEIPRPSGVAYLGDGVIWTRVAGSESYIHAALDPQAVSRIPPTMKPRGSPQNRPYGVTSKPAIGSRPRTYDVIPCRRRFRQVFF